MENSKDFKWLWNRPLTTSQRDKLCGAICSKGDLETLKWLWNQSLTTSQRDKLLQVIIEIENKDNQIKERSITQVKERTEYEYDAFICHASEDKESFVRELAEKLSNCGLTVWYDEFTLSLGDSLRRKIDYGLKHSRYGVVILSKSFFEKEWPQKELDGLVAREREGKKVILPIWHGVTEKEKIIFTYSCRPCSSFLKQRNRSCR